MGIMQACREAEPTASSSSRQSDILEIENLEGQDICHAITALVVGIARQGSVLGIASEALQQTARLGPGQGMPCLTLPAIMVVPLLLYPGAWCGYADNEGNVVQEPQGSKDDKFHVVGHWIVVIARRGQTVIRIQFLNSLQDTKPWSGRDRIQRVARTVVRNTGWAGTIPFDPKKTGHQFKSNGVAILAGFTRSSMLWRRSSSYGLIQRLVPRNLNSHTMSPTDNQSSYSGADERLGDRSLAVCKEVGCRNYCC